MSRGDILLFGSAGIAQLQAKGFQVEAVEDVTRVPGLLAAVDKPGTTPKMSPEMNDFTTQNCFWSRLVRDGETAAVISARYDDIQKEDMGSYVARTFKRHYPTHGETITRVADPIVNEIGGRLAYVGELFVAKGRRGSQDLLATFMRTHFALIATKWRVDWIYAYMRDRDVKLGFAARYGFTRTIPYAQDWAAPPEGRSSSEWLVALSAGDLAHLAARSSRLPDGL